MLPVSCMRKKAAILLVVLLAMAVRPLQLPAASCILSEAPIEKACKMDCCGSKSCCATSKDDTRPVSQPLSPSGHAKQLVIAFVAVPLIDSIAETDFPQPAVAPIPGRGHSPPPLAASCIRLI